MRAASVEPRGFRNLADSRIELGPAITLLHGPNGAGKTNLLEAVYFALVSRSFRAGNDRDLIAYEQPSARVELELAEADGAKLLAAVDRTGDRRHLIDGRPLASSEPRPLVSVFHPDRMELVKGPPAKRRAHFDRLVGALWPARADLRARYGRTLAQRNALVSRIASGLASPGSLATWDERLADEAVPLISSRAEAISVLEGPVTELGGSLGLPELSIRYRPRTAPDRAALAAELAGRRDRDLGRAYTSFGPQLDEFELRFGDRPLKRFGSQGQHRIALLALLLAERRALIDAGRPSPLMLLDDVMSELDPTRRELLVETLADSGQALITATERDQVPAAGAPELAAVAIRDGRAPGETATAALPGGDGQQANRQESNRQEPNRQAPNGERVPRAA